MAVELFFSNQVEPLAKRLSEHLSHELIEKKDKFDPAVIIVPNRNMVKWLQLTMARFQAVLFNARFDFLENGLWYLLSEIDSRRMPLRLMDHKVRTFKLIQCLKAADLNTVDLEPIAGYLLDPAGRKRVDFAARLWQLAERFSALFQEYEYHRADMIGSWQAGKGAETAMERCQRYLYCTLYLPAKNGNLFKGPRFVSLMEYAARILENSAALAGIPARTIHIFGMSQISMFHTALLGRLGEYHRIRIYTLNPSQEFWEDFQSVGEQRWFQKKAPAAQSGWEAQSDHPLLAAWGKAGRENVRQLCALTDYTFQDCYHHFHNGDGSVLQRLQSDLLTLAGEGFGRLVQDRSLQIFAAPSRFREVETVYHTICADLRASKDLKLTDVAILVPDMNLYQPIFDAIFNRTPKCLSYNLADSNAQSESLYGQAVMQILELAQGRFTRRAVFDLLLNPCLMQRWDISADEIRDWVGWADELNIFHTFSRRDLASEKSIFKERFSWKQALQRLRLGRIMTPFVGGSEATNDFCDVIPFSNLAASNIEVLEKFCVVIETLYAEVQNLAWFQGSCHAWVRRFALICDRLITVPEANTGETAVQYALLQDLEEFSWLEPNTLDQISDQAACDVWDIDLFREFILSRLKGISGGKGDYLTTGITISALQPMRPIPFKIIFILGMEEGQFPGRAVVSALDLRLNSHRREDITLPERNCYLFLEMLLSARSKLYLGYVARDLQKDRAMPPCSVINQLIHHLDDAILSDGESFKIKEIPLKGNDPRYLDAAEITQWSDVMHNFSLADRIAVMRTQHHWAGFLKQASLEDLARIRALTPVLNTSEAPLKSSDQRRQVVTTAQLARFLIDPVRQSAQTHLGLYGQEESIEDLAMKEDEPFFSIFPLDYRIEIECLRQWLELNFFPDSTISPSEREPETIVNRIYAGYEKQSAAPDGVYGQLDRATLLEKILGAIKVLAEPLQEIHAATARYRAFFWGNAQEVGIDLHQTAPIVQAPPLEMVSSCVGAHGGQQHFSAEIHAALNWVWQDGEGVWHTLILTGARKVAKQRPGRHLLAPLLAYLVSQAQYQPQEIGQNKPGQSIAPGAIVFHLAYATKIETFRYALSPQEATACLKNLLEGYGNQKEFYWLPFETVLNCKLNPFNLKAAMAGDEIRSEFADELAEQFEAVDDYLVPRLAAPIGPELFDVAEKRFGWIFKFIRDSRELIDDSLPPADDANGND